MLGFSHLAYGKEAQQATLITHGEAAPGYAIPSSLSEDERYWFVKFQEGNLLVDGWQDITKAILDKTPADQVEKQKQLLAELGNTIGLEWCKDNETRAIDTSMLKNWATQLKKTAKNKPEELEIVLVTISNEVASLAID
ncbi:MAG: hypothetical protein CSB34_02070 [Desulfobulbus propionicus]|nr:MAG: hypothetical protein CSB34_02070 [Desulfobulbus propionicus]PIE66507.1 MAG: hypothetical protein CSA26_00605 [Desulfobacterales bacterium]